MTQERESSQKLIELQRLYVLRNQVLPYHESLPMAGGEEEETSSDCRSENVYGRKTACGTMRCLGGSAVLHPAMQALGADSTWIGHALDILPSHRLEAESDRSKSDRSRGRLASFFGLHTDEEVTGLFGACPLEHKKGVLEKVIQRKEAEVREEASEEGIT